MTQYIIVIDFFVRVLTIIIIGHPRGTLHILE